MRYSICPSRMIYSVIVTYHPEADFLSNLSVIIPQVTGVIIVHNGGDLPPLPQGVTLIENTKNIGLAAAQNQGIEKALELGAEWVLLLDDDSTATPEMVKTMLAAYEANPQKQSVGLIAPRIYDKQIDKTYRVIGGGKWWFNTKVEPANYYNHLFFAIASGSLIKRGVLEKIGMMRERFFIDHIDTEFCARMLMNNYTLMSAGEAKLIHALGNSSRDGNIIRKNYPPERYYTQYRNMLWVVKEYGAKLPAYALLNIISSARELARILAFEPQKCAKFSAILRGLMDGLTS